MCKSFNRDWLHFLYATFYSFSPVFNHTNLKEQLKALSNAVNPLFQNYRIENSQDTRGENSVMEGWFFANFLISKIRLIVDEATNHITLPDQEATRVQVCDGQNISSLDPAMKNLFNLLVRCNRVSFVFGASYHT